MPWQFTCATLTIPAIGIVNHPITPVSQGDGQYQMDTRLDQDGNLKTYPAIVPGKASEVDWYAGNQAVGGILSAEAQNTNGIWGHSSPNPGDDAIFTRVPTLQPGDEAIVDTCNGEHLVYVVQQPSIEVAKGSLMDHPEFQMQKAGRLVLVTCYTGGEYTQDGHAKENSLVVLQLRAPAVKSEPTSGHPRLPKVD